LSLPSRFDRSCRERFHYRLDRIVVNGTIKGIGLMGTGTSVISNFLKCLVHEHDDTTIENSDDGSGIALSYGRGTLRHRSPSRST
jgi:PHP family Zn ribbon phosphoesterase